MKRLFIICTALFWGAFLGLWAANRWHVAPVQPTAPTTERRISLAELARHATENDCWMAIDGQVYDVSAYLPDHPSEPEIVLPWCGKEATNAYRTKTKGRPHSARADAMLPKFRVGVLEAAASNGTTRQ